MAQGRRALVTGASSGIGAAFAEALAARGHDLVLAARRVDRLEALAERLRAVHGVRVEVEPVDLQLPGAAEGLVERLEARGLAVDMLVNNAGVACYGELAEMPADRAMAMVDVNVRALTAMSRACLPGMVARRHGAILNVGSLAGFVSIPYGAIYAATKAYVLAFSEALAAETAPHGIRVLCLCPGSTESEIHDHSGVDPALVRTAPMMRADTVVAEALNALEQRRTVHVPGALNEFTAGLSRFLPRPVSTALAGMLFRPSGQ